MKIPISPLIAKKQELLLKQRIEKDTKMLRLLNEELSILDSEPILDTVNISIAIASQSKQLLLLGNIEFYFNFQEFLYSVFYHDKNEILMELITDLFYKLRDLQSTHTLISILLTRNSSLSSDLKTKLSKILLEFTDNSLERHEELISSILNSSYNGIIVPNLLVIKDSKTIELCLKNKSDPVADDRVVHWLLNREFDQRISYPFMYDKNEYSLYESNDSPAKEPEKMEMEFDDLNSRLMKLKGK